MSIKALLKEAKHAFEQGEFVQSMDLCEGVLREDSEHYFALLILGAAATAATDGDYSKKGLDALVKAHRVKPDQDAPWQGLLKLFRKHPALDQELYIETLNKLIDSTHNATEKVNLMLEKAEITFDWALLAECLRGDVDESVSRRAAKIAHQILQNKKGPDVPVLKLIAYRPTIDEEIRKPLLIEYLKQISLSEVESEYQAACPSLSVSVQDEIAIQVFMKTAVLVKPAKTLLELIEASQDPSTSLNLAKAKLCLLTNDLTTLEATCKQLLASESNNVSVRKMLIEGALKQCQFRNAEMYCKEALRKCKGSVASLLTLLARALRGQCRYAEALIVNRKAEDFGGQKVGLSVDERLECLIGSGCGEVALGEAVILNNRKWFILAKIDLKHDLVVENDELSNLGMKTAVKYLFYKKRYNDAIKVASVSLKQNMSDPEMLTLLGRIYLETNHPENALKCLQQSFVMNRFEIITGQSLSRSLRAMKKHDDNKIFLESFTSEGTIHDGNKWAFFELALHFLETGTPALAVAPLQKISAIDKSAFHFELLGEAYAARKSFAAAALSFKKCLDMRSERRAFVLYRLARVTEEQDNHEDAITLYEASLNHHPEFALFAHDLGRCCLKLAGIKLNDLMIGPAKCLLSKALACTAKGICNGRNDLISLWNLLGDILLVAIKHRLRLYSPTDMKARILLNLCQGEKELDELKLITMAERTYLRCMSLNSTCFNIWHNLSLVYKLRGETDRSLTCIKRAIKLNPTCSSLWNTYGVLLIQSRASPEVCQSSFIRAVTLDPDHAAAWTNLGFVYLKHKLLKEANMCFSRAQAANPLYVESWLGQASLAATVGHFDARDLYRHSNVVKPTKQGIICSYAMSDTPSEELLYACERALGVLHDHQSCAAAGATFLSYNLTKLARRVLSRCNCVECEALMAQSYAVDGNPAGAGRYLAKGHKCTRLTRAYLSFRAGHRGEALAQAQELCDVFEKKYNPQALRRTLQTSLRRDPRDKDGWRRLVECLIAEEKYLIALKVSDFLEAPYQREALRARAIATLCAGQVREAYRASATLVRSFPEAEEHWVLFRWATLAMEKRSLEIPYKEDLEAELWFRFSYSTHLLDEALRKGKPSQIPVAPRTQAVEDCETLLEKLKNGDLDNSFLNLASKLLKSDIGSEAGFFLTGLWAIALRNEELYKKCSKALPAQSSLKMLLDKQKIAVDSKPPSANFYED